MTFLVSTRLPARVRDEIRLASGALGVAAADFTEGMPIPPATVAVVAGLPAGARRVPPELARLTTAGAPRIVLCAAEPMVRPVTTLLGGRVILIAPPFEPRRLRSGLRVAVAAGGAAVSAAAAPAGDAGQSLRAEHWLAWARHPDHGARVAAAESAIDVTAVAGPACTVAQAEQAADAIRAADGADDAALERALASTAEGAAVLHLAAASGEWVVYGPPAAGALWLCSPWRAPARWCLSRSFAASGRRLARVPAYPHDVLVLCDHAAAIEAVLAAVEHGAIEAYAALRAAAAEAHLLGVVVEAR